VGFGAPSATSATRSARPGLASPGTFRPRSFSLPRRFAPSPRCGLEDRCHSWGFLSAPAFRRGLPPVARRRTLRARGDPVPCSEDHEAERFESKHPSPHLPSARRARGRGGPTGAETPAESAPPSSRCRGARPRLSPLSAPAAPVRRSGFLANQVPGVPTFRTTSCLAVRLLGEPSGGNRSIAAGASGADPLPRRPDRKRSGPSLGAVPASTRRLWRLPIRKLPCDAGTPHGIEGFPGVAPLRERHLGAVSLAPSALATQGFRRPLRGAPPSRSGLQRATRSSRSGLACLAQPREKLGSDEECVKRENHQQIASTTRC
jgi:hypothetical protein